MWRNMLYFYLELSLQYFTSSFEPTLHAWPSNLPILRGIGDAASGSLGLTILKSSTLVHLSIWSIQTIAPTKRERNQRLKTHLIGYCTSLFPKRQSLYSPILQNQLIYYSRTRIGHHQGNKLQSRLTTNQI